MFFKKYMEIEEKEKNKKWNLSLNLMINIFQLFKI